MADPETKEEPKEEEILFSSNTEFPEEIKEKLRSTLKGKTENIEPTKMSSQLKEMLDKDFGSGWKLLY
ncbi:hypothetical protein G9O61_00g008350 [Vairimorpha ceranae]|nr:hypothetical protein G9O61_00g008350 [Vairimorpha ceranae]